MGTFPINWLATTMGYSTWFYLLLVGGQKTIHLVLLIFIINPNLAAITPNVSTKYCNDDWSLANKTISSA